MALMPPLLNCSSYGAVAACGGEGVGGGGHFIIMGASSKLDPCRVLNAPAPAASQISFCSTLRNPHLCKPLRLLRDDHTSNWRNTTLITAVIKRRKDFKLDSVIQRQKKLKLVSTIKDLLIKEPGMVMSLKRLGMYRKKLGLGDKRRIITLLKKYPAVFEVFEEGVNSLYFRLTFEAEDGIMEENRLKKEMEDVLVIKLRKMLMMSIDKTLLVSKIDHFKKDFGLPDDYRESMLGKYPEFFKVVETPMGSVLELTSWDPELAISAWEKRLLTEPEEETISGRPRKFAHIDLPKGYALKRKDKELLRRFQQIPHVSAYADFGHFHPASKEAEKHSCAVVHEILSLTLEKRTLIDHLTHFRKDYKFSQQLHGSIIRHPELFYVSLKGQRDSVFLREAYKGSQLIEKDPQVLAREKLAQLVAKKNQSLGQRNGANSDESEEEDEDFDDDDNDSWSDAEEWDDDKEALSDGHRVMEKSLKPREMAPRPSEQSVAVPQGAGQRGRVPRRPPSILRREEALAAKANVPREIW